MQQIKKLKALLKTHQEPISYLFFGGLTTLVNLSVYWFFERVLSFGTVSATIIGWILSVLFAYITNRRFVFHSKKTGFFAIIAELSLFVACRLFSGFVDVAIMYVFVDKLHFYDMLVKIASNVLVIILNFAFSKLLIFHKKQE